MNTPTPDTSREALAKLAERHRTLSLPDQSGVYLNGSDLHRETAAVLRALSASPAPSGLTERERAKVDELRLLADSLPGVPSLLAIIDRLSSQAPSASAGPLFALDDFTAHSGITLPWKINCDALTDADWRCLAEVAAQRQQPFSEVVGVPRGGIPFAKALTPYVEAIPGAPRLIVDDVLTTGASMREAMTLPDDVGLVVFARGPLPPRVTALFTLAPSASGDADKDREIAELRAPFDASRTSSEAPPSAPAGEGLRAQALRLSVDIAVPRVGRLARALLDAVELLKDIRKRHGNYILKLPGESGVSDMERLDAFLARFDGGQADGR